jgi:NADH-quinone oxidoreductase subunit E
MSGKVGAGGAKQAARAYVLIKGKPVVDLVPCFESLRSAAGVLSCDTVIGDWDMLVVFQAPDRPAVDQAIDRALQAIDEIDEYQVQHTEDIHLDSDSGNCKEQALSTYSLVEIDPSQLESLVREFSSNQNTACFDVCDRHDLVILLMRGETIEEIKRSRAQMLARPGVLRSASLQVVEILGRASQGQEEKVGFDAFGLMLWRHHAEQGMMIPLLQAAQDSQGYVTKQAIEQIAEATGTGIAEIYGVVTFYKQFRLTPLGKHIVRVCQGTACHVMGADFIAQTVEEELKVIPDETTSDGLFTYMEVACLGCCSLAPVVMIDDQAFGRLTPQKLRTVLRRYRRQEKSSQAA